MKNRAIRTVAGRFWLLGLVIGLLVGGGVGFMLTQNAGAAVASVVGH